MNTSFHAPAPVALSDRLRPISFVAESRHLEPIALKAFALADPAAYGVLIDHGRALMDTSQADRLARDYLEAAGPTAFGFDRVPALDALTPAQRIERRSLVDRLIAAAREDGPSGDAAFLAARSAVDEFDVNHGIEFS